MTTPTPRDPEPVMATTRALDDDQQANILFRWNAVNPHQAGAEVPDILDMLAETDSDLDLLEPFWDDNRDLGAHPASSYATRALLWGRLHGQDRPGALTRDGLAALLAKIDAAGEQ